MSSRLRGYLVLGTNGEFRSLSTPESMEVLKTVVKTASPDKVIMAGTGAESTSVSIELCHQAAEAGAHYGSLITPYFFAKKMSDSALINHFTQVAEQSPIPVLLYNNPGVTGITMSTTVIKEVSSHPKILGMKDSSPGNLSAYILNAQPGFYLLAGSANFFFTGLLMGAVGGVLSLADAFPEPCCKLYDLGSCRETGGRQRAPVLPHEDQPDGLRESMAWPELRQPWTLLDSTAAQPAPP